MEVSQIIAEIDNEIARLTQAKSILTNDSNGTRGGKVATSQGRGGKRILSPEARQRIAEAQRKRWAKQKKAAK